MKKLNILFLATLASLTLFVTGCAQQAKQPTYKVIAEKWDNTSLDVVTIYTGMDFPETTADESVTGTTYYCSKSESSALQELPRVIQKDFPQSDFSLLSAIITEYKNPNSLYWHFNNTLLAPAVQKTMKEKNYEISFTMIGNPSLTTFMLWGNRRNPNGTFDTFAISNVQ